jgi:hypothetical protein
MLIFGAPPVAPLNLRISMQVPMGHGPRYFCYHLEIHELSALA